MKGILVVSEGRKCRQKPTVAEKALVDVEARGAVDEEFGALGDFEWSEPFRFHFFRTVLFAIGY